jgi:hypothetical protein
MKRLLSTLIIVLLSGFYSPGAAQTIEAPTLGSLSWASDHLELPIGFKGTGDLSLSVSEATCPVQLLSKTMTLPAWNTLFIAPKGRSNCLFVLAAQNDGGDDAKWRLEVGATGDTGFSVVVKAAGSRDPSVTPNYSGAGSVGVHGGWGALRVDGTVRINSSDFLPDGNILLQYQDSRLQLADDSGARDHPAGDVGRGLYFAQGLSTPIGYFDAGAALPFGQNLRVGAGWRGEYACGQVSTDISFADPIFAVQAGAQGIRGSLSYRPNATEKWGFGLEYRSADWIFKALATEARGSAEASGFSILDGLGWIFLKSAKANYDGANFTTTGKLDINEFGIVWDYNATNPNIFLEYRLFDLGFISELRLGADITYSNTPGYARIEAIYDDGALEFGLASKINTASIIGVSGYLKYSLPLEGRLTLGVKFEVPDVSFRSNYTVAGILNYGSSGWLVSLELGVSSIFRPNAFIASLSLTNWSFIGVAPPIPNVRFVPSDYAPPIVFSSPCN